MKPNTMRMVLSCVVLLISAGMAGTATGNISYVKWDATGSDNGTSWANAYVLLESALQAAQSGDDIWIAAGTYKPTNDYGRGVGARGVHFRMKNGVSIYGGFSGTESTRDQRDPAANGVILSGDIGTVGDASDNCYHIFYHPNGLGLNATALLDGVTLCEGNANGSAPDNAGGGMYNYGNHPKLENCTISVNSASGNGGGMCNTASLPMMKDCRFSGNTASAGGGMYNLASSPALMACAFISNAASSYGGGMYNREGSPIVIECTFSANTSGRGGGGMYNLTSSLLVRGCTFRGNTARYGGGISNDPSSATVTNCVFIKNTTSDTGGGLDNFSLDFSASTSVTVTNCTFSGNMSGQGGGMFNNSSSPVLRNCIFWGNSASTGPDVFGTGTPQYRYCNISGSGGSAAWQSSFGTDNGGNIDRDPLFLNPASENVRLRGGSPCIDAADGAFAPTTDIIGYPRFDDPNTPNTGTGAPTYVDIGAYEYYPLTLLYPSDSGICLERGKTYYLEWLSDLPIGTTLRIELIKGGSETWEITANASKNPFKWTVGKWKSKTQAVYPDGDDYRIRISTLSGGDADTSDFDFAIGSVTSLTIDGLASVTGGATAQYTCTAQYNYGADREVTNEVKWRCDLKKYAKMGKTGLLTTKPVLATQGGTISVTYGKAKPPPTGLAPITLFSGR